MIAKYLLALLLLAQPSAAEAVLSCTVTATGVAFGTWSPSPSTVTGTITVGCKGASSASYTVSLSTGSGTYATRLMRSGSKTLSYNLYTSAALSNIWGNATQGTSRVSGSMTIPGSQTVTRSHTIYGKVASSPQPGVGSYSDTITVSVIY
jgi:spore coat protein U-like protein